MAEVKEIRDHIKSVQETLKITNAMYLLSSANLRKAKKQLGDVEPYFRKIISTISDILHHSPETPHKYFDKRTESVPHKVGYIIVTGDKGLAGAYNHNVLKRAEEELKKTPLATLYLIGQMGASYFQQKKIPVNREFAYTAQNPTMHRAREISDFFMDLFERRELDELYIIYTRVVSPLVMEPRMAKLLPLDKDAFRYRPRPREEAYRQTITYVPSEEQVLSVLVPGFVIGMIFGALVESFCSEQSCRMTAMEASSQNAREMLKNLNLTYSRARQSSITQEITEIVAGTMGGRA
ncbi:MAG: ATP synthase F1 subunit gamma [Peptococcaceae bacterium]|nr:ATP synthase F1 subunit gamma [Peptococcaceae bacterium]